MIIYWHSNAPWSPTGYGNQTAIFPRRLRDTLGHGLTLSSFYGLNGSPRRTEDMWVFPAGREPYGNDTLVEDAEFLKPDIVITLMDIWVLQPDVVGKFRWCPWLPVDHDPAPPPVIEALQPAYQPIVYSQFGMRKLQEAGYKPLYVPHGVETGIFQPYDRDEARAKHSGCSADVFLVGIVAANKGRPSRKAFDQQIRAFAELHKRHRDTMLYIHTDFEGENMGENLARVIELAGIPPSAIGKPDQYRYRRGMVSAEQMVALYNSFDVLMNATRGEGFGIPILEAQACGVPVIVTDFSAMPELCFAGWKVGYTDREFTYQGSYQVLPSVTDIADALEEAYQMNDEQRAGMRAQARAGALTYDADLVTTEYWKPALEAIEARIAEDEQAAHPADHTHRWAKTGLYVNGQRSTPCLVGKCAAAKVGRHIRAGVFPSHIGGVELDIEDDAEGGVSKIVMREALDRYHLDRVELHPGDVVIDIGAHVGIISIYLAKRFPGVTVYAFEPMGANYQRLLRNIERNGVAGRVHAYRAAVTGDGRTVQMPASSNGNSGGLTVYAGGEDTVLSTTLGRIMANCAPHGCGLLKIDCEGAEYEILGSGMELLKTARYLVGEFHTNNLYKREQADTMRALCASIVGADRVFVGTSPVSNIPEGVAA